MLLIADSGSTKTDWRLVDENATAVTRIKTEGLNPYFLSPRKIADIIEEQVLPVIGEVDQIFFYGAGCGSPQKAQQVKDALSLIPSKFSAEVAGDTLGSARSLLQNEAGTACILGTGSNSCLYNGRDIVQVMPSLGFMFSDWGSGTVLGKDLVSLILQQKLPGELIEEFHQTYEMSRVEILDRIYNKPLPNRFLASFTPFLLKYSHVAECRKVIIDNFRHFFHYYVLAYPITDKKVKVSFTGSIATTFSEYLTDVASSMDIMIDKIVQHPMEGLVKYHCVTFPVHH
jgi:N-acetylglucosamine kinase-like BadF-type ATPase